MSKNRSIALLLAAIALGSCTLSFDPPMYGGRDVGTRETGVVDGTVVDGAAFPDSALIDALSTEAGPADAGPIDLGCTEGVVTCTDGIEMRCSGGSLVPTACDYGCAPSGARCGTLVPSNVRSLALDPSLAAIELEGETGIDTDACTGAIVALDGGRGEACVLSGGALLVASDAVVTVRGTRPLVLLIGGDAVIDGVLEASATSAGPGPSGADPGDRYAVRSGAAGDASGLFVAGGGGGGGCGAAGVGGASGGSMGGMPGASDVVFPRTLEGGGAGAAGGQNEGGFGGRGGAGGGAIQITALGRVIVRGAILAGGAGGTGGRIGGGFGAGGGGGAGGVVWIEARTVEITETASVLAGGGGGGGGAFAVAGGNGNGSAGADGSESPARAMGGSSAPPSDMAGAGGLGGGADVLDAEPGLGGYAMSAFGPAIGGGGGGGGAGCVYLRTGSGAAMTRGAISPTAVGGYLVGPVDTE